VCGEAVYRTLDAARIDRLHLPPIRSEDWERGGRVRDRRESITMTLPVFGAPPRSCFLAHAYNDTTGADAEATLRYE